MSPRIGADLDTIVRAAAEIADTSGLEAVTLASVAQKLNIRSPSLYNHVDGLPALRRKLAVHGLELLHARLASALAGRTGAEAVYALADTFVAFSRSNPGLYEATLKSPDAYEPEWVRLGGEVVGLAMKALEAFELPEEGALHAVRGIRSIIQGFTSLVRAGGFGLPLEQETSLRLLLEAFLAGLHVYRSVPALEFLSTDEWDETLWKQAEPVYEAGFPEHGRKPEAIIRRMFRREMCRLFVLKEDGRAVGMALGGRDPESELFIVDYLAVDPDVRGRGYGKRMVASIRKWADTEGGCTGLLVEVEAEPSEENRDRIRFWESCGFTITDYVHHYIWVPEPYRAMVDYFGESVSHPDPENGKALFGPITRFHERAYRK